jgi:hypothetical protein
MSYLNYMPARCNPTDRHAMALSLLNWSEDEAGEQPDSDMVEAFEVHTDEENNTEGFWLALDKAFPDHAERLRRGESITISAVDFAEIANIPGFEDDDAPDYAPHPLLWTSCWTTADED